MLTWLFVTWTKSCSCLRPDTLLNFRQRSKVSRSSLDFVNHISTCLAAVVCFSQASMSCFRGVETVIASSEPWCYHSLWLEGFNMFLPVVLSQSTRLQLWLREVRPDTQEIRLHPSLSLTNTSSLLCLLFVPCSPCTQALMIQYQGSRRRCRLYWLGSHMQAGNQWGPNVRVYTFCRGNARWGSVVWSEWSQCSWGCGCECVCSLDHCLVFTEETLVSPAFIISVACPAFTGTQWGQIAEGRMWAVTSWFSPPTQVSAAGVM